MKRIICSLFLCGLVCPVFSQEIKRPAVEFSKSGIYSIDKIVIADTATIVDVRVDFIPGWWTMFSKNNFLEDAKTGEKYYAKKMEGGEFDKKLKTPASGHTLFTLIFPKLGKKVEKVNFGGNKDSETYLFGISLTKSTANKVSEKTPSDVQQWLDEQIRTAKVKTLRSSDADFFAKDSIKVVGYIKGYDKRVGFSSGIIYHKNVLTREDFPTTIRIFEDGRFESAILANHPVQSNLLIKDQWIPFYAEPGNTIALILDWQEFLNADRYRNIRYDFKNIEYLGSTKTVNEELQTTKTNDPDYRKLEKLRKTQKPDDFKAQQLEIWDRERKHLDSALAEKNLSETAEQLIRNQLDLKYANFLFDYTSGRSYYQQQDSTNKILKIPLNEDYHDFIKRIDLSNQHLIVADNFSTFINRYEFSPLFPRSYKSQSRKFQEIDSVYSKNHNNGYTFIYNVAKLRRLAADFERSSFNDKESGQEQLVAATANMDHPFLLSEAKRVFDKAYNRDPSGYELPKTAGGDIFKRIINKHKGKVLIVDFWAQWCGPCRSGIEHSLEGRTKIKDKPELDFVYITDEEGTSADFYAEFTKKNLMTHTYRITSDEYLALRELFRFNGIPRYVLVDDKGRIRDDNFEMHNYKAVLPRLFPEKFDDSYFK